MADTGVLNQEELQRQNAALRQQLEEVNSRNRAMWVLLVEIGRRLQVSSASIKAAVSSLLGHEIFWDGLTQHEFLQTIDSSADQASDLIMLVALAFRAEAGSLEIHRELQMPQETLTSVGEEISRRFPGLQFKVDHSESSSRVLVDYDYLIIALKLLIEVLVSQDHDPKSLRAVAAEEDHSWILKIQGIDPAVFPHLLAVHTCQAEQIKTIDDLSPENLLKLFVTCQVFRLQDVHIEIRQEENGGPELGLRFPAQTNP